MSYKFVDGREVDARQHELNRMNVMDQGVLDQGVLDRGALTGSMLNIQCEECYQAFANEQDFKSHNEYCIQPELPVLDSFEKETEDGQGSNTESPPKLEPIEQDSCEESSSESELQESSTSFPSDFNQLAYSFEDDGECPSGYKEVFTKSLRSADGKLSALYSIQRPEEWSDDESIEHFITSKKPSNTYVRISPNNKTNSNTRKPSYSSETTVGGSLTTIDGPNLKAFTKMKCPICDLILFRHNYGAHYRIHSGELPYQCYFCERKFRTTSSRKVHHRWHTGEKPYICKICPYKTITKRNLDRHIFNQHIKNRRASVKFKLVNSI